MESNESTKKPWINDDGSEKTTDEIKEMSKKWTPEDWEEYLADQEVLLREKNLDDPTRYENTLNEKEYASLIFGLSEYSALGRIAIQAILAQVPFRQREVLRMIFWEGMTQRKIAAKLKISRGAVRTSLFFGLEKIKKIIRSGNIIEKIRALKSIYPPVDIEEKLLPQILRPEKDTKKSPKRAQKPKETLVEGKKIVETNL